MTSALSRQSDFCAISEDFLPSSSEAPPCQDISSANTKGKGVDGERSGLFFEAIRLIGECRPRWFALENSANLRTRGSDAVLAALEALGYACWPLVVRAGDIGANHERPRCWIVGCDVAQVGNADFEPGAERLGHSPGEGRDALGPRRLRPDAECGGGRPFHASDTPQNGPGIGQMAIRAADSGHLATGWPLWSLDDLAGRLWLDAGLPARVAGTRVAVGGPRGTAAASLIVEAYGDAVVPQIPEAIGRAILRVEAAMRGDTHWNNDQRKGWEICSDYL